MISFERARARRSPTAYRRIAGGCSRIHELSIIWNLPLSEKGGLIPT
jgi:hypothetical protein